jgi:hypothetical protein
VQLDFNLAEFLSQPVAQVDYYSGTQMTLAFNKFATVEFDGVILHL